MLVIDITSPAVVIFIVTFALVLISRLAQRKMVDQKKMKEIRKTLSEKNKKWKALVKEGESKKKEADELFAQIMRHNAEMMKDTQKLMIFSLPFLVIWFAFDMFVYPNIQFESLFLLPAFNGFWFIFPIPTWTLTIMTGFRKAYAFYYFFWLVIIWATMFTYDKIKERKEVKNEKTTKEEKVEVVKEEVKTEAPKVEEVKVENGEVKQ